jgi:hypothetical protein
MRSEGFLLLILALFALLVPAGCGDDPEENLADEWGDFLVGTWQLVSISVQDQSIACPGEIEVEEGVWVGCGEMTTVFGLQGFFRTDMYWHERYSRMEGSWRLVRNELVLEATEGGESDTGPVEDAEMQRLEPAVTTAFTLQRSGDRLWMTETSAQVAVTAVLERG